MKITRRIIRSGWNEVKNDCGCGKRWCRHSGMNGTEPGGIDGGDGGGKRLLLALLLFLILESVSTFLNLFNRFWLV